jgi:hypothetical protein
MLKLHNVMVVKFVMMRPRFQLRNVCYFDLQLKKKRKNKKKLRGVVFSCNTFKLTNGISNEDCQ